ncbi:alanine racemase [Gryllotalpicola ginsengisoli]|uniref:alanine racemase n=1 Tax=Gryllotalpicola ginsengisoli TaxID=444608 RepID=UPI0003B44E18|nr:alanine racemase [Gryllotalpicola ginsengisoli]
MPEPQPAAPGAAPAYLDPVGFREAVIDLDAIASNVRVLRALTGTEHFIAVVKADGYGHGAVPSARAALAGGADWLGVATVGEALELRAAGIEAPVVAWLHDPAERFDEAVAQGVSLGVSSLPQLRAIADATQRVGRRASVQLKLDTGLSRNGLPRERWSEAFGIAAELELARHIDVVGLFTHLSNASPEDDAESLDRFDQGLELARGVGLAPDLVHAAASAAALRQPEARYNTVRLGLTVYGLSPFQDPAGAAELGLRPAMTLQGRAASVKRVPAGTSVSYDYTYTTERETTLVLVPFGYGDGIPRAVSNRAAVWVGGGVHPIAGRVAMDQFVVDAGDAPVSVGDPVVLFGDAARGVPPVEDWARAADTINWEIVTRIGGRTSRRYVGSAGRLGADGAEWRPEERR